MRGTRPRRTARGALLYNVATTRRVGFARAAGAARLGARHTLVRGRRGTSTGRHATRPSTRWRTQQAPRAPPPHPLRHRSTHTGNARELRSHSRHVDNFDESLRAVRDEGGAGLCVQAGGTHRRGGGSATPLPGPEPPCTAMKMLQRSILNAYNSVLLALCSVGTHGSLHFVGYWNWTVAVRTPQPQRSHAAALTARTRS